MTSPSQARARLDVDVLQALQKYGRAATYVIRNTLSWSDRHWFHPGLKTSDVLRSCRRLERLHLIEQVPNCYVVMKTWQITPAGLGALDLARQKGAGGDV